MKTRELIRPNTSVPGTVCTLAVVLVFEQFPKDAPSLLLGSGLVSDPDLGYRPRRPVPCPMYQLTTIRLNQLLLILSGKILLLRY